jgi:hypothetical protein
MTSVRRSWGLGGGAAGGRVVARRLGATFTKFGRAPTTCGTVRATEDALRRGMNRLRRGNLSTLAVCPQQYMGPKTSCVDARPVECVQFLDLRVYRHPDGGTPRQWPPLICQTVAVRDSSDSGKASSWTPVGDRHDTDRPRRALFAVHIRCRRRRDRTPRAATCSWSARFRDRRSPRVSGGAGDPGHRSHRRQALGVGAAGGGRQHEGRPRSSSGRRRTPTTSPSTWSPSSAPNDPDRLSSPALNHRGGESPVVRFV